MGPGPLQQLGQLAQVIGRLLLQRRHVVTAGDELEDQGQARPAELLTQGGCSPAGQGRVLEIGLQTIKAVALATVNGLLEVALKSPEAVEQQGLG